jgi:predicted acyltransferase
MEARSKISPRFSSVDALRGLTVAAMLLVNNAGDWNHVYAWLEHATWHGCAPPDFIFPFFLVIVGVSLHLALEPKLQSGSNSHELARTVTWRGLRIFALGVCLHLIAQLLIPGREFRLLGVLQRIGICFVLVGLIAIYVRKVWMQSVIFLSILLAYWGILWLGGSYEQNLNIADKIDTQILGKLAYSFDVKTALSQEPEGILSTLPAIATVMLGLQAGAFLRSGVVQRLWQAGFLMLTVAALWSIVLPLNKQLWTSSFVLWTGGFAYLLLALAHRLIDLQGLPAIGQSFGVNAIAAYAGSWVATCLLAGFGWMNYLYPRIFTALLTPYLSENAISLAFALVFTAGFGLLMWVLKRRGWRFSI